jgi:hypothetical protein
VPVYGGGLPGSVLVGNGSRSPQNRLNFYQELSRQCVGAMFKFKKNLLELILL